MGGSNTDNKGSHGVYGTLGVPAALNSPSGRSFGVKWTDSDGHFWLFGGLGSDAVGTQGFLNDLWEYDPSAHDWAWMGGSSNIGATCIQITSQTFCGESGVYGTLGAPASGNAPGGREWATSWSDYSGHLWLFGGWGFDSAGTLGFLNDLWEFDPTSKQWTWMGGSSTVPSLFDGEPGIYGTLGTPASTNIPGARYETASWTDHDGNFWLFGGVGYNGTDIQCYLNDLWEYSPTTHEWTWKSGSSSGESPSWGLSGIYGTMGKPAADNVPGSRQSPMSWTDGNGNLWLFGGYAFDVDQNPSLANDLWEFNISTNQWAWMNGYEYSGIIGSYGTLGEASSGNVPGPRTSGATWTDTKGNIWLSGGSGSAGTLNTGALNDLWQFSPSTNEWTWMGGADDLGINGFKPGVYGTLGTPAATNIPGSRAGAFSWIDTNGDLWLFSGAAYDANGDLGGPNDLWKYGLSAGSPLTEAPMFSVPSGTYSAEQTVTITDTTADSSIYFTTDGSTPTTKSMVYSGPIGVSSSETIAAIAIAPGYSSSVIALATYTLPSTNPAATPEISPASGTYTAAQSVSISDVTSNASIYYTIDGTIPTTASTLYTGPISVNSSETIEAIAVASGYANSPVATAQYVINLPPPTFSLTASLSSLTVKSGGSGIVILTATPQNGFSAPINFSCSGLPAGATCSFDPTSVTPSGGATTTQLTFNTSPQSASSSRLFARESIALTAVLCLFGVKRRSRVYTWLVVIAVAGGMMLFSGCGGGGSSGSGSTSTPITSSVTVTATSGSIQQTVRISLTED
ncbi:chitobiase/beta-hexosaminidase C-terminal domain-containing protein [Acidicapsa dinghuensis]|uniref:Chitobiase/beta-hexosaminidase C-terminal domain-containing protein n=1 Tax=Acidicapsa dinghuensis TaxID=2218256 RepID=A0ABW1EL84_9BACT|nr:chitobiase/beta-hexosaminidase C-terminal domain-containing protein [Acidicapsa dinghuensis]